MKKIVAMIVVIAVFILGIFAINHEHKEQKVSSEKLIKSSKNSVGTSDASEEKSSKNSVGTSDPSVERSENNSIGYQNRAQVVHKINSGLDAEKLIKQVLGYTNNSDIISGSVTSEEKGETIYIVQLKSQKNISRTGGAGTIGYYKVYENGDWKGELS